MGSNEFDEIFEKKMIDLEIKNELYSHYVDDMDENSVDAAILASLSMEHQVVPHDTLLRIIRKIFVDDKTTHTLVQHLRGLGLRELEMYHKPFLLGLN